MKSYSVKQLAEILGAELKGEGSVLVSGLAGLSEANGEQVCFCAATRYLEALKKTRAAAVLVNADFAQHCPVDALIVNKPESSFAALTQLFSNYPEVEFNIHPTAVIAKDAVLARDVSIAAHCVIESAVTIGEGSIIGPGCVIGENATIGKGTRLFANVTVYHQVQIGDDCIIHSGSVLGSDGFGFVPGKNGYEKLYQLGTLIIGDRVELGSNCTLDRGALGNTIIGNGVKMDNQVHIGHNVVVGENTAFAGCVGIAGSTRIGANCQFGGQVGINGHIEICDGVIVTGASVVMQSIETPGVYSGGVPAGPNKLWLKNALRFNQLSEMAKTLKKLESLLKRE